MKSRLVKASDTSAPLPPKMLSSKEFGPELQKIALVLEDKSNWERRYEALKELTAIFSTDCSTQPDLQQILSSCIRHQLRTQIEDLRSSIAKEACASLRAFISSSSAPNAVEIISDWFTSSLFNLSCSTISVMASSAEETLRCLASSGRLNRGGINSMLAGCSSKHATIRKHAFTCLLLMLQSLDTSLVSKHGSQFEGFLRTGVVDAVQEVRYTARVAFWAFEVHCPKDANSLMQGLEHQVQRAVTAEKETYFEWLHNGTLPGKPGKVAARSASAAGRAAADPNRSVSPGHRRAPSTDAASTPTKSQTLAPPTYDKASATKVTTGTPTRAASSEKRIPSYAARGVRPTTSVRAPRTKSPDPNLGQDEAWFSIVSSTQSHDWLCRLNAITSINDVLDSAPVSHTRGGECVQLLIKMLSDSHYRVVIAATAALERLLTKFPDVCLPFLERLMVPLFPRLADTKEQVREASRAQLEHIRKTYPVETLFPILHKVLDAGSAKSRVACVEFMSHLVGFSDKYFGIAPQLRTTVNRLLSLVMKNQGGSEVSKASLACLGVIYDRNREAFVSHIVALPTTEQTEVLEVLRKGVPHLSQDVRRKMNGEVLLPHAPVTSVGEKVATRSPPRRRQGPTHVDPSSPGQQYKPNDARAADMHSLNPTSRTGTVQSSPIAAWRAERANPPEISALKTALTSEEKRAALQGILGTLITNINLWIDNFKIIIPFPISQCADASDHQLRAMSQQALRNISAVPPLKEYCTTVIESFLRAAVSGLDDAFESVQREALQTFTHVLKSFPPKDTLPALIKVVEALLRINARCLQLVLRELSRVFVSGRHDKECRKLLPDLVQLLTGAFEHDVSEVRKTVVLNFVDLYNAEQTDLLPLISHLAISKLKLISIYINRSDEGGSRQDLCKMMSSLGLLNSN